MRIIGNKTHGDLAEVGMVEFINQFMYDYRSEHVGKDLFRAKGHEEDILIIEELTQRSFPVSLKAYGNGPLQLSTDSQRKMFSFLQNIGDKILFSNKINHVFLSKEFEDFKNINVIPLIYNEKEKQCNIMVFNYDKAMSLTSSIVFIDKEQTFDFQNKKVVKAKGRKHPIFMFLDDSGNYICEVRYGGASDNALQRGLWTHTINANVYFDSLTDGWIDYSHNETLIKLFKLALNSTSKSHQLANEVLQRDIDGLKKC